jgi:hypothetical protein
MPHTRYVKFVRNENARPPRKLLAVYESEHALGSSDDLGL